MKRVILLLAFLFFINLAVAVPELKFQTENHQSQETILGLISGISNNSDVSRDDLHVYEQRREVFFEKDLVKINNTYYFYIIPTKEGNFSIRINNVLFGDGGGGNIQQDFNVTKKLDLNNKTQILTLRPGFYVGNSPSISIINSGQESLNVSVGGTSQTVLIPGETKKIDNGFSNGFSFINISSYDEFSVPILNYGNITTQIIGNKSENNTSRNYSICLKISQNSSVKYLIGSVKTYSTNITNACNFDINNAIISSNSENAKFDNMISFNASESKNLSFVIDSKQSGVSIANVNFSMDDSIIAQTNIIIYSFVNETNLENFTVNYTTNLSATKQSCEQRSGIFCTATQSCSSAYDPYFYDNGTVLTCCFDKCIDLGTPINSSNIIAGLVGVLIIILVIYFFYKRSKKIKTVNPEDRFKEVDKKYQKDIAGKQK